MFNKQEYYRQEYKKKKVSWKSSPEVYRNLISENVDSQTKILDIGCGHGLNMKSIYKVTKHTYGLDSDSEALEKNTIIQNKKVGTAENLPFLDNFFDIVVLEWVLEHLENPQEVFDEIYRVLKPGGKVIFLTPNVWNYNVWIIRLIPNVFHDFLTRKLYQRQENDTYPTRYRINSYRQCQRILEPIGFSEKKFIHNGDPSYISFNRFLFLIALGIEKILDCHYFQFARVHLIACYQKK